MVSTNSGNRENKQQANNPYFWRRPGAQRLLVDTLPFLGQNNYTRFIILSRSRTGSNMLKSLIDAHPGTITYGEIFADKRRKSNRSRLGLNAERFHDIKLHEPVRYLTDYIFGPYTSDIRAVGLKLFYYHARDEDWHLVWQALERDENLHVLHLTRRNILRTHLSRVLAEQSQSWVIRSANQGQATGHDRAKPKVELDGDALEADFVQTRKWEREAALRFKDHPTLHLTYEQLAGELEPMARKVDEFLGLPERATYPVRTRKQSSGKLRGTIVNYDELKRRFAGTEWEGFFEE